MPRRQPPTDETLVALAQGGDRSALEMLLERQYPVVTVLCRRLCGNHHDAQDCAQNALIAISRNLPRFDGRAKFSTWAYRVATNACLDELRRRRRRPHLGLVDDHAVSSDLSPTRAEGPEDAAVRSEQRGALQRALDDLPVEFREPLVLRDVAGLDYAEIADALDIAPGTVRSRISRGRSRLARALGMDAGSGDGNHRDASDVEALDTP